LTVRNCRKRGIFLRPIPAIDISEPRRDHGALGDDGRSLRKISAALAEQGHTTREGTPFSASIVKAILGSEPTKSPYIGKRPSHGKRILNADC
jgi:hypothetical protein